MLSTKLAKDTVGVYQARPQHFISYYLRYVCTTFLNFLFAALWYVPFVWPKGNMLGYAVKFRHVISSLDCVKGKMNWFTPAMLLGISLPGEPYFSPYLYIPGLRRCSPTWDISEFPWIEELLVKNFRVLRDEYYSAARPENSSYGMKSWGTHIFYANGIENEKVAAMFPKTAAILKKVPRFHGLHTCFSLTRPNGHIAPHHGHSNALLRVQFAIDIPNGAYFEVAGEKVLWTEGQAFVFDDSYYHGAWNPSPHERVVFFLDFFHPDLSDNDTKKLDELWRAEDGEFRHF